MSIDFTTSTGLRMLLTELHYADADAWRHDPDAAALMEYATDKYASLATKHGLEPDDAAYAAFNVLRTDAVRRAHDPWAVTTRAVQVALIYDERANGLLCSTHQARRAEMSAHHDAERFGDRETSLLDYHPAFHVQPEVDTLVEQDSHGPSVTVHDVFEMTVRLFTALGWPEHSIRSAISYVSSRLMDSGNRATTHEGLRKDGLALRTLDLAQPSWTALLTTLLGSPRPEHAHTRHGHGIWYRFLLGETPVDLLDEDDLVRVISASAPTVDPRPRLERILADVS